MRQSFLGGSRLFVIIGKSRVIDIFFSDGEGYDGGEDVAENAWIEGDGDSVGCASFVLNSEVGEL